MEFEVALRANFKVNLFLCALAHAHRVIAARSEIQTQVVVQIPLAIDEIPTVPYVAELNILLDGVSDITTRGNIEVRVGKTHV